MNLTFSGDTGILASVQEGIQILLDECKEQPYALDIRLESALPGTLSVQKEGSHCRISCNTPAHFFRCLNRILCHPLEDFCIQEQPAFEQNGFMLDCSRNSVASVETVKSLIRILAKLGMNQLLLYTEDTYQVPGLPYFGAYRGGYSQEELRELDRYAQLFGVELVPCIQTLAHLHNALKWPMGAELKDSADILKVGSEKVYAFIETLLDSLKTCFTTRQIHIGMDEAVSLGLGNYLKENGYKKSALLVKEHSLRVLEICRKLGWEPMMWSDMYITSNTGSTYYDIDENTNTSHWEKPDPDLGLVYWDYYNADKRLSRNMLRVHKELSSKVIFAGGIWNWNGIAPNYGKAIRCTAAALEACREQQISHVFATGWLDNGAETPIDAIYPGLAAFAQLCFREQLDQKELEQLFEDCIGGRYEDFYQLDAFDSLFTGIGENQSADNPSKYLLYQDPLLGIFDYHIQGVDTHTYYSRLAAQIGPCRETSAKYADFFAFYETLALVLADKADLGIRIKAAYDSKDLSTLRGISDTVIPRIAENLWNLRLLREKLWMKDSKPFGYELLDIKLGGVSARLESCRRRLNAWLEQRVSCLEELEQERLPYWTIENRYPHRPDQSLRENLWNKIVSGCDLIDTI